jgi:hypothetical protein
LFIFGIFFLISNLFKFCSDLEKKLFRFRKKEKEEKSADGPAHLEGGCVRRSLPRRRRRRRGAPAAGGGGGWGVSV